MAVPNSWGAVALEIETLNPAGVEKLAFAKPMDNNIRIVASDYMALTLKPPYYGDSVSLKFWKLLGIPFGSSSGITPLTLIDGYKYIYNYSASTFSVFDTEDVLVKYVSNVTSIGDMNIDFTILNSHQFEIHLEPGELGNIRFIFPAKWLKVCQPSTIESFINNGVNNIYLQDRVRPYSSTDVDNPINDIKHIKHIGGLESIDFNRSQDKMVAEGIKPETLHLLHYAWDIDWDRTIPNNDFGRDGFDIYTPTLVKKNLWGVREEWNWLLPILGTNMYPRLLPILRPGEVNINRPVYEPWSIMDIPLRVSIVDYDNPFDPDPDDPFDPDDPLPHPPPIITDDPEDEKFVIPVFDLSPRFQ